ncbi:hypothetical protein EV363DRAFT_1353813 [Boletus edulis]|nr:hypothetical protein EV363DRAFT_1353813 [Boletus edulis]
MLHLSTTGSPVYPLLASGTADFISLALFLLSDSLVSKVFRANKRTITVLGCQGLAMWIFGRWTGSCWWSHASLFSFIRGSASCAIHLTVIPGGVLQWKITPSPILSPSSVPHPVPHCLLYPQPRWMSIPERCGWLFVYSNHSIRCCLSNNPMESLSALPLSTRSSFPESNAWITSLGIYVLKSWRYFDVGMECYHLSYRCFHFAVLSSCRRHLLIA